MESTVGCVLLREFQNHTINDFNHAGFRDFMKKFEVTSVQGFLIANRTFGADFQDVSIRKRFDQDFQTAVKISAGTGLQINVVTGNSGSPSIFADDGRKIETRKMVAKLFQTVSDMITE